MKRLFSLAVGASMLVACSSNGSATVDGTVAGVGVSPSTAFVLGNQIFISSNGNACTDLQNGANGHGSQDLVIAVAAIEVGTLQIDQATFQSFDEVCNAPIDTTTATGTVTFSSVDTSGALNISGTVHGATGTYDITFGADHITGSFTAVDCSATGVVPPTQCD